MKDTLQAISNAEFVLDQILDGSTPVPPQQQEVPVAFDENGTPTEWETFETPMMADEFGNFVGSDNANHYTYTSGVGSITIYDHGEDASVRDRLTFEGISSGQVSYARDDHDLVVSIAGGDTVTINNYFMRPTEESYARKLVMA